MKIKEGYLLRKVAGSSVVIPLAQDNVDFNGMMTLSETGALLWEKLEQGTDKSGLLKAILDEYDIDEATALADIKAFIEKLEKAGILA